MKFVKKIFYLILIMAVLLPNFFLPKDVLADSRTIRSIREDIEKQKQDLANNQQQQQMTEAEIAQSKANIDRIENSIKQGREQVIQLNNEIDKLKIDIKNKQEEIKKVVNFLQVANGESVYMEYIFGAKTFTDFIYRMSISEQLVDYNDKLVDEFNQMIEQNKKKQEEIQTKEQDLAKQQEQVQAELAKLQSQQVMLTSEMGDIEDGIRKSEEQINTLIRDGCSEDETVDDCYRRLRQLPSDTEFWRPLNSGYISSAFGPRTYWYGGRWVSDYHYGLDIGVAQNTPVYAVANGQVASTAYWPGTGYVLYVYHTINGVNYTSVYEHLNSYNSYVGQNVTKDTVIAYSGNTGQSSGPHLHVSILRGWAGIDYGYWSNAYMANNLDPATKINFPPEGSRFYTRTRNCSLGSC